jgi:hypothetical protein
VDLIENKSIPFPHAVREGDYIEPRWPKVRVRVLKPFFWREEIRIRGAAMPLGPNRLLAAGEIIECIAPDASSLVALGRAEFAT